MTKSDLILFIERLDYVDYICELCLSHSEDRNSDNCEQSDLACTTETNPTESALDQIAPKTARSILIAGEIIIEDLERDCETYASNEPCSEDNQRLFHEIRERIPQ